MSNPITVKDLSPAVVSALESGRKLLVDEYDSLSVTEKESYTGRLLVFQVGEIDDKIKELAA